ncbi:MAG TPA: divergent PAP2 family protein [Spirochaetia bacterium]|nr:divergent PAP2 family protein [Spirochaetales bacterium]HRS65664.1 divergent PAP2 family protein [Spirochaetia bacterium]HOT58687.1 divergent PAP2 family protein [Spirochaetales bacterium]HPD79921.1 divergent PAP2 family protein [Spirochaetales bacterium]HQG39532.1 divergent PAP2 family protein [Spirochaetales bacterium]
MYHISRFSLDLLKLLRNPVFQSAIFSWFLAQFVKTFIRLLKKPLPPIKDIIALLFWKTGGMPSSHSALTVSITTAFAIMRGITSDIFILSFFVTMVIIRDALGVRRVAGLLAKSYNIFASDVTKKMNVRYIPVKEIHGHKVPQVIVGSLLGLFIAIAVCTL